MRKHWLILSLLLSASAVAQEPEEKGAPVQSIVSSSRHFVVRSADPGANIRLGIWADEIAESLGKWIGEDVPFGDKRPLYILLRGDQALDHALIRKQQGLSDGLFTQELRITNFAYADQEDLLEELVALLLNRYAVAMQPSRQRGKPMPELPGWFTVGIAQQLYPALRARNRQVCTRQWAEGRLKGVAEVLAMRYYTEGRSSLKCTAAMYMAWMHSLDRPTNNYRNMFQAWSKGEVVDISWLTNNIPGLVSEKGMAKQWSIFMARSREIRSEWGGNMYEVVDVLKSKLNPHPKLLSLNYPDGAPDVLTPRQLLDLYNEEWFVPLLTHTTYNISFQGLGQPPELQAVIYQYQDVFEALKALRSYHEKRDRAGLRRARVRAEKLLAEADLALAKYEARLARMKAFVDLAEQNVPTIPAARSATERFVDAAENRAQQATPRFP